MQLPPIWSGRDTAKRQDQKQAINRTTKHILHGTLEKGPY